MRRPARDVLGYVAAAAALAFMQACVTVESVARRGILSGGDVAAVAPNPSAQPPAPPADEATSVVLLRVRQTPHGAPVGNRKGLRLWLANMDKGEPLRLIDTNQLPAALAAEGWIAWRLPAGAHQLVVSGWPIPPGYLYETPLDNPLTIRRSYHQYCSRDGFARVQDDLHRMLVAMVPEVLALHGIVPPQASGRPRRGAP